MAQQWVLRPAPRAPRVSNWRTRTRRHLALPLPPPFAEPGAGAARVRPGASQPVLKCLAPFAGVDWRAVGLGRRDECARIHWSDRSNKSRRRRPLPSAGALVPQLQPTLETFCRELPRSGSSRRAMASLPRDKQMLRSSRCRRPRKHRGNNKETKKSTAVSRPTTYGVVGLVS